MRSLKVRIIASSDMDGIASAEVLSRYFCIVENMETGVVFATKDTFEFILDSRLAFNDAGLITVGVDVKADDITRINATWQGFDAGIPIIWTSTEASRKYMLEGKEGKELRKLIAALPGHVLAVSICRIILTRNISAEAKPVFIKEYERYSELEEGEINSVETTLLPLVYDPLLIFEKLYRSKTMSPISALYKSIKPVKEMAMRRTETVLSQMQEIQIDGHKIGIIVLRDKDSLTEKLMAYEYFSRGGEILFVFCRLCHDRMKGMMRYIRVYVSDNTLNGREILIRVLGEISVREKTAALNIFGERNVYESGVVKLKVCYLSTYKIIKDGISPIMKNFFKEKDKENILPPSFGINGTGYTKEYGPYIEENTERESYDE